MDHYYVYSVRSSGNIMYERTCGVESAAKDRVKKLIEHYAGAFYTKSVLPEMKTFY